MGKDIERSLLKERVKQYCKRITKWEKSQEAKNGTEFNKEENTKIKFVVPLLNILGWDYLEYDIEFEHHIPKIKGREAADLALYTREHSKSVILVEVKPIQNDIGWDNPTKIFEYMIHGRVKYGIATNGKQLFLFDNYRTRYDSTKGSTLLSFTSTKDLVNYNDVLNLLSKEKVSSGMLTQFAEHFHKYSFFSWRETFKTGNRNHDEFTLRLEFAREFLNRGYKAV